jgi:transcriptional regulator with XRE-family HTH domain
MDMATLQETFRQNLKRMIRQRNMTQRDLSRLLEVSDAYVSQLLNGKNAPTLDTIDWISAKLETPRLSLLADIQPEIFPVSA